MVEPNANEHEINFDPNYVKWNIEIDPYIIKKRTFFEIPLMNSNFHSHLK